jgi:phosphoserine aminotransferase
LDDRFIQFALGYGCDGIKGHRLTKGCRASIYNAMSIEGVKTLIQAMNDFETMIIKERTHV